MLTTKPMMQLGTPNGDGAVSLESCIRRRRSIRDFAGAPLSLADIGQLLWAAQGVTAANGGRAAPSAGGLYPLEMGVAIGRVASVPTGVYRYWAPQHGLTRVSSDDAREGLAAAALGQRWIASGPAVFYIAAAAERTMAKYGGRGRRYVWLEAGHAAENLMLQAVSLGLGATMIGAFADAEVAHLLALDRSEAPLCLIPVGRPQEDDDGKPDIPELAR